MKRIITYNVNGIRAAVQKGFIGWLRSAEADIVCIQETKAQPDQIPVMEMNALGYNSYIFSAKKKGYSGVSIFSKTKPDHVEYGIGIGEYDLEGILIRADFGDVSVMSVYHPSGTSGDERQAFKMKWLADFQIYIEKLVKERPNLILSGDFNICHKPIDIHDPVRNAKSSGFLPEEREWMTGFLGCGFIDTFRFFNKEPNQYTWWSYIANARAKNLGWRIDYHLASLPMASRLMSAMILPQARHSDHCPALLEVDMQ
ncbi:MAG: exodeoxyribonuclease III [Bacteroidetes bacterium]|nr:exodeoxyribonuclease III [Bacteroidota bacterium]